MTSQSSNIWDYFKSNCPRPEEWGHKPSQLLRRASNSCNIPCIIWLDGMAPPSQKFKKIIRKPPAEKIKINATCMYIYISRQRYQIMFPRNLMWDKVYKSKWVLSSNCIRLRLWRIWMDSMTETIVFFFLATNLLRLKLSDFFFSNEPTCVHIYIYFEVSSLIEKRVSKQVGTGQFRIQKVFSFSSVCGVGLEMIYNNTRDINPITLSVTFWSGCYFY